MNTFTCFQCGETKTNTEQHVTGYGLDKAGNKICFACCGLNDARELENLKPKEKFWLYWDGKEVINWPGTLRITPNYVVKGRHNIARTRETVYFMFKGHNYTGVQYGSNTQVLHIKRTKDETN